ncbi:Protein inaperturate pollen 1 [Vitis vinifera]|uniref:Protein inaperturate pollen 1 n=1 Tax=Vitis vinifera TaxID=29760 RepID=A0A438K2G5_VITVI|nr:Protein inaperturate pollen 1 [Vitis vinifera]
MSGNGNGSMLFGLEALDHGPKKFVMGQVLAFKGFSRARCLGALNFVLDLKHSKLEKPLKATALSKPSPSKTTLPVFLLCSKETHPRTQPHTPRRRIAPIYDEESTSRKKACRPFKDYYAQWIHALNSTLLPLLRRAMLSSSPSNLSTHVEMVHHHFQAYYEALDLAASNDVAQLLYPEWRNSLEKPFLWLGDFHPYLFTNLLRSFLDDGDDDDDDGDHEVGETCSFCDTPWQILMAWKNPSETLMARIEQIECALRLMVPALVARVRNAQLGLFDRVATDWGLFQGKREGAKAVIGKAVMGQMDEMLGVFLDANRLRKSVLAEIIGETNVYQAALFLEGLAQFFVGFRDHELLSEFERCTVPIN